MTRSLRRSRGFALILALFLIVTLAAIGAYMLTVSNVQVETGVMDEQGARAYQAARAGIEWGAYQVLQNPAGTFATTNCVAGTGGAVQDIALPNLSPDPANPNPFRAQVKCQLFGPETEAGTPVRTYRITSTGCNQVACLVAPTGPTSVNRQLELTVAN
jgi:MSHA biogenesis protein MshP